MSMDAGVSPGSLFKHHALQHPQHTTYAAALLLPAGEVPWVMRIIKTYHAEAARKGVKIVNFCGFDSIPSDLGTTFVVNHMQEKLHK